MKIKVGNKIIYSGDKPIVIIFGDNEDISTMIKAVRPLKYFISPKRMSEEEIDKWMES